MSEISRASRQSTPAHTSRQSAPSYTSSQSAYPHVSRQSTRSRQEPPVFTESSLPQQTRRRPTHTDGKVPLPTRLDNVDDAGGAQAFQPPITSTEPARSRSGPSPFPTHIASGSLSKVIPMRRVQGDYHISADTRFDAINASDRQSEDPGAARAKASVSPQAIVSNGAKGAPANVANFVAHVREEHPTPTSPTRVSARVERYVESVRGHAERGDLADPNISFNRKMDAVQRRLVLPHQVEESDSRYAHHIKAVERSRMEKPATVVRPASWLLAASASQSSDRAARSARLKAWCQDVFERGVLQMIYDRHMIEYSTSTVPKQDVGFEIINGLTMAYIPSKPDIQVVIPHLDDPRCRLFVERYPLPALDKTGECNTSSKQDSASISLVVPVVQTQKEPETILEHEIRETKVDEVCLDVPKPLEETPAPRESDVLGQCGMLVEEISVLKEVKTEMAEPVQVRMARIDDEIIEMCAIVPTPCRASIDLRAGKDTTSAVVQPAPMHVPPPLLPSNPDPSDNGSDGGDGGDSDIGCESDNPGHNAPDPGDGIPPPRMGDGGDNGPDDGDDQNDHSPAKCVKHLQCRSTSVLNEINPVTIDEFVFVPASHEAGVLVLDSTLGLAHGLSGGTLEHCQTIIKSSLGYEENRLLHFFELTASLNFEYDMVCIKDKPIPTLLQRVKLQEITRQYSANVRLKKKLEGLVVLTKPRPSQSIPRKDMMSDMKTRTGASAEGERSAHPEWCRMLMHQKAVDDEVQRAKTKGGRDVVMADTGATSSDSGDAPDSAPIESAPIILRALMPQKDLDNKTGQGRTGCRDGRHWIYIPRNGWCMKKNALLESSPIKSPLESRPASLIWS